MSGRITVRPGKAALAIFSVISAAMLASACASPAPPRPYYSTRTYQGYAYAQAAIVECLIAKHVIPQREVSGQSWFAGGAVRPNADFAGWFTTHGMQVYGGKRLVDWVDQARRHWPASYCGPSPAPSAAAGG